MKDVELAILLDVIFSNSTKENLNYIHKNLITIINERYKNRLKELSKIYRGENMSIFEKIEITFIIIEAISIIIEISLQIYQIKSSKQMEQNILNKIEKINIVKNC